MGRESEQALYFSYGKEEMRRFYAEADGTTMSDEEEAAKTRKKLREIYEGRKDAKRNIR